MSALPQIFTAVAGALAATVINALWQDGLLVVCVWLLLRVWPGVNAATRYAVWTATLVAAIVVPVATTLPFYSAPQARAAASETAGAPLGARPPHAATQSTWISRGRVAPQPWPFARSAAAVPERAHVTVPPLLGAVIALIWLVLAAYALVRLVIGLTRLEQLKRDALPLPVEYRDTMAQWMRANKGARDVRLCVSDETDVPVAVGLFDAMILIPRSLLESLSQAEVDQISLHELAHLRRADDWTNSLQRVIIALLGWNPAALFIGQQLDLEREVACDDWVLSFGGAVRPYALCLTKMAETSSWPRQPMAAPGVFATRKHISLRIERLLRAGRNVATSLALGPAAAAIAVVGALSLAIGFVAPSVAMPIAESFSSEAAITHRPAASSHAAVKAASTAKETVRYVRVAVAPSAAAATSAGAAASGAAATPSPSPRPSASPTVVHLPGTHVHVPAQTIHVPGVDVDVPGYSYSVPTPKVDVSGIIEGVNKSVNDTVTKSLNTANLAKQIAQNWQQNEHTCSGCNFKRVNWSGRDMHGAVYDGVNFAEANLAGVNFSGGAFAGVNFERANLAGASFMNAKLTDCNFGHANLSGANFNGATLQDCNLSDADLANVDFSRARLIDTNLPERRGPPPPAPPAPPAPPPPPPPR